MQVFLIGRHADAAEHRQPREQVICRLFVRHRLN
jgi:hypothetical protein